MSWQSNSSIHVVEELKRVVASRRVAADEVRG